MEGKPTVVTVTMKGKPEAQRRLKEIAIGLTAASRAEEGCLAYRWQQASDDPNVFLLYMIWRDEASFDRHVRSPHVKEFDDHLGGALLSEPYVLTRWQELA